MSVFQSDKLTTWIDAYKMLVKASVKYLEDFFVDVKKHCLIVL